MTLTATVPFDADEMTTQRPAYEPDCYWSHGYKCQCDECRYDRNRADDPDVGIFGMKHDFGMYCECPECAG